MLSSKFIFLSLGTLAAGFSFTGLPATATVNILTSGTLIRDENDPTAFSLLLRLDQQNGGTIIQTFKSEKATSIPFSFTPTESGSFIIEVISNLTPISDTTEPDQIYASSNGITISEPDNLASVPPTSSSSSSENAGTSSSSQNANTATSANAPATTAANADDGQGTSSTSSSSPVSTSSKISSIQNTGPATVTGIPSSINTASVTTNAISSQSTGPSAKGELGSGGSSSSSTTSGSGTPSDSNGGSGSHGGSGTPVISGATNTSPPGSTGTLAPSSTTSKSADVGLIVGIVFGVLAFITTSLVLFLAYVRRRRRQRTNTFKRQLMTRQVGSSPLVFNMVSPPGSTIEDANGYREYNPSPNDRYSTYSGQSNADMMETGTVTHTDLSHVQSMYSEQSVNSMHSDSPSIFYTAVPRVMGMLGLGSSAVTNPPPTPPPSVPLPPAPVASTASGPTPPIAPPSHPQLAPGWVFPRIAPRASQLPPPKTDRQMDIYDRKVRLQGKLITLQGWGNAETPPSEKNEVQVLKEQIRRLELLENSDWALGKSNELPSGLT